MKKSILGLCAIVLFGLLLNGCNRKTTTTGEAMPFNPYVEAFTTGKISRHNPVYILLNQEVDSAKMAGTNWKKAAKITPQTAGTFAFENAHTIVFKPAQTLERNTEYAVNLNLSEWFEEAEGTDKQFQFKFSTLPLTVNGYLQSFDPVEGDELLYDVLAVIQTSDAETPETVEPLVRFSENNPVEWTHSADGKRHEVIIKDIAAQAKSRVYDVSVASNRLGVPAERIFSFDIPGSEDFTVFSTKFASDPQRYIEVTFSKNLDPAQEIKGLAYIRDNGSQTVTVEGNKLRLYPDAHQKGTVTVVLEGTIRSENGATLGETLENQVAIPADAPSVKFVGSGTIIPQSAQLTVPFQAIYLRGVIVRVIKIQERNVGQFLQINQLDQNHDLMRVGRLVARKTIFFDEDENNDLTQLNTYALDLRELIEPEPGAIYRLELSADKSLSAYPCEDGGQQPSKEQILAQDELRFKEEASQYDETENYYYYYDDYDYYDYYDYYSEYSPCSEYFWYGVRAAKNVLATNIGLMAMAGETNEMIVLAHNLLTAQPERGVEITVRNFQHIDLGKAVTDESGKAVIAYESGKPFYLIASKERQRAYLRVDGGSALSLSSFDVAGETVQKGIKGFIYGDRGVWRPGDTLYLSFMLNDRAQTLPANHPVTMELVNPMGQVYLKKTTSQGIMGTYTFEMPTDPDAMTGSWTVNVNVGGVTFTKRVRIETIKPNRLKIDIRDDDRTLLRGEPMDVPIHVEWMTGATARNLDYDIQGTFQSTATNFPNYRDFVFDDPAKTFNSEESSIVSGTTDDKGDGTIRASFDIGTSAPGMLTGNFVTRVFEESGDFSIDAFQMRYSPYKNYIGINSPQKDKNQLNTGSDTRYEVVSVDYTGKPVADVDLEVTVYKVRWYWWWSSDKNRLASYISDSYNQPVKTMTLKTGSDGKGSFSLHFTNNEWGTYYISVKDRFGNHSTGTMSYYDWPNLYGRRDADGNPAANILQFKTDKEVYAPGEKMTVTIPSTAGARAVVSVLNGSRVLKIEEFECRDNETTLSIDVTEDMQPNAYVYISLLQPHGNTQNDLPIRLYGVVPVTVTSPESRLNPVIAVADELKPEERYEVSVSEKNGREMSYTLAIVDEGLLDLTRFRTPDPWSVFNAREALGVSTWDLYNYVVGAYGGRIEQYFSIGGDDELNSGPKAIVNRFPPVVQFAGPFQLKKGEKRRHWFEMPNYNGRVRVMVIAGDGKAYGNAEKSAFVRKPVMILGTLPRVIGVFEEMDVPAAVFATKEGVGNVQVTIQTTDNMEVIGERQKTLNFSRIEDQMATFRVRVKGNPGAAKVTLTASGGGEKATYETDLEIRSVRRPQTMTTTFTLEPGQTRNESVSLPGAEGTNKLALELSDMPPLNLTSRLDYLLGYPHGCLEQITSKAFPQLYVKEFASLTREQEASIEVAVKATLDKYRSYQMSDGAFSYWPGGSYYNSWAMTFAIHFMVEAEAKGYLVPANLKNSALSGLRRHARDWRMQSGSHRRSEEFTQAYRLFVLAVGKTPELGAMNRLKENKDLADMTRWMLAAAYATVGRADVATSLIQQTKDFNVDYNAYDLTYGSNLRDKAIRLITLCLLNNGSDAATLMKEISESLSQETWYSTQTTAFSLMSASAYMSRYSTDESMTFSYAVNGQSARSISTEKHIWTENLLEKTGSSASLAVTNTGKGTLFGRIVAEGTPNQGEEEAYENGVRLTVAYQDGNGRPVSTAEMEQGINFKAVVTISNPSGQTYRNLAITQVLPAGWEILNTRFLNDGAADENTPGLSYQDIRDDRVYSYIDYLPSGRQVTFTIDLSAIYRGKFYLPPVYVEAMYDYLVRANTTGTYIEIK